MRRGLIIAACGVVLVPALLLAALLWVLRTESGAAWIIQAAAARSDSALTVGTVAGKLSERLTLTNVGVRVGSDDAFVDRLEVELELGDILFGRLTVRDLLISELRYRRSGAPPVASGDAASVPIAVEVANARIIRTVWIDGDEQQDLGPLTFSLAAEGDRITLLRFSASGFGVTTEGNGSYQLASGEIESLDFAWTWEAEPEDFEGTASIEGTTSNLNIDVSASSPFDANVQGQLQLGDVPRADLRVSWTNLAWPGLADATSPAGALDVSGWIDSFDFSGGGNVVFMQQTAAIAVAGNGTPTDVYFDNLDVVAAQGSATARGTLGFDPLRWNASVDGRDIDPSYWYPEWPGDLRVSGNLTGSSEQALQWRFDELRIDGVLRDVDVAATGAVGRTAAGEWLLEAIELRSGDGIVRVDGQVGESLEMDVEIAAPDVAAFWPDAAGSLTAKASVSGTRRAPAISGNISGRNIGIGDYFAESLTATGSGTPSIASPLTFEVDVEGARWRDLVARTISGRIEGLAEAHRFTVAADTDFGMLSVDSEGAWRDERWHGELRRVELSQPSVGLWNLDAPASLDVGTGIVKLDRTCLRSDVTSACIAATLDPEANAITVELRDFDLALLSPWLPEEVAFAGRYDASLEIDGPWSDPRARVQVAGDDTLITVRESASDSLEIPIRRVEADAALEDRILMLTAAVLGQDSAELRLTAGVTDIPSDSPLLDVSISGVWPDLSALSLLSPDVGTVSGRAVVDVQVAGTPQEPLIQGELQWLDGMLSVPRWGFTLENANVSAATDDGRLATVTGSATAGEGRLNLSGLVELDPSRGWPGSLKVTGDTVQAVRLPDTEIFVMPNLDVQLALPDIEVEGTLDIPSASVRLGATPEQATLPSADTVVHGLAVDEPTRPLSVRADLAVNLGDDVRYFGGGLEAALGGSLALEYLSGTSSNATGNIDIEGQYQAYGQTLILERSRLFFAGPIDNPDLDVRAVRHVDATVAGVQLTGPLRNPTTRVFSEPAMAEADALSYLLFGRPLSDTEAAENATLQSAAVSMGLQQALPVVQRIGETLGFDEFSVQTTAADTGELMAGKQLSPRLYMRYTYGLFNRLGGLLMRLELNDRLSLETRSGEYKSMDLIYSTEQN